MENSVEAKPIEEKYHPGFANQNWKLNIVEDADAPALYSRRAIYFFTIFFSVLFGGTLMFINVTKQKNTRGQWIVTIYTIVFMVISSYLLMQIDRNSILTLLVSMIGATPFYTFFWAKYIGRTTKYRAKSIVAPLVIGVLIFTGILFIIFSTM